MTIQIDGFRIIKKIRHVLRFADLFNLVKFYSPLLETYESSQLTLHIV